MGIDQKFSSLVRYGMRNKLSSVWDARPSLSFIENYERIPSIDQYPGIHVSDLRITNMPMRTVANELRREIRK